MKHIYFLCIILLLFSSASVSAQVSFRNPTYPANFGAPSDFQVNGKSVDIPSDPCIIAQTGTTKLDFNAKLYRPVGSGRIGYVDIFLGSSSTALQSTPLTVAPNHPTTNGTLWAAVTNPNGTSSGFESLYISGSCTVNASSVANNTGLYAVYYETSGGTPVKGEVSHPVLIKLSTSAPAPAPTPSSPGPTRPFSYYFPCRPPSSISLVAGDVICSSVQCVPYNSQPGLITGRVQFNKDDGYYQDCIRDYGYINTNASGEDNVGTEKERVQWQYSYNNQDWFDIQNDNGVQASLVPFLATIRTYYRRVSTHIEGNLWHRAYWYTSEVVTIVPFSPAPTPVQPDYNVCTGGSTVVTINNTPNAVTYNWNLSVSDWTVNGNSNHLWNTTSTSVTIAPPPGTAPGTEVILYVNTNGLCGDNSGPNAEIRIRATSGASTGQILGYAFRPYGQSCNNFYYNVTTAVVANASSYSLTNSRGQVISAWTINYMNQVEFETRYPQNYLETITIKATGGCNSSSTSFNVRTRTESGCPVMVAAPTPTSTSLSLYPNPASEQVIVSTLEQDATATFYNAHGTSIKTVELKAQTGDMNVSTVDLPSGLYYVRIISGSKMLLEKQLQIQH